MLYVESEAEFVSGENWIELSHSCRRVFQVQRMTLVASLGLENIERRGVCFFQSLR